MNPLIKTNIHFFYIKHYYHNYFFSISSKTGRLVFALTSNATQLKNKKLQFNMALEKILKKLLLHKTKLLFLKLFKIKYKLTLYICRTLEKHKIKLILLVIKNLSSHNGCRSFRPARTRKKHYRRRK
jgi:hypothetical protein